MGDGEYGSTTEVKRILGFSPTDTVDDTIISTYVDRGNRQVDNDMAAFIETIPVASDSITDDLQEAADLWACRLYVKDKNNFEREKSFKELYRETISGLQNRLRAIPTVRTSLRAMTTSYRTDPLQNDDSMTFETE